MHWNIQSFFRVIKSNSTASSSHSPLGLSHSSVNNGVSESMVHMSGFSGIKWLNCIIGCQTKTTEAKKGVTIALNKTREFNAYVDFCQNFEFE